MLEEQIQALGAIWRDQKSRELLQDSALSLMKLVFFGDIGSGADALRAFLEFNTPTVLYWDKMWRYTNGVIRDPADQVKLAEKFYHDEPKYKEFVKRQMSLINEINDDKKIDYFAMLTRCFLYTEMDEHLYLKLAKFLSMCTPGELVFLRDLRYDDRIENSMLAYSLYQYGLLKQAYLDDGTPGFVLSDFGKALKQDSLNFDEGIGSEKRLVSYDAMIRTELVRVASEEDIDMLFQNQEAMEKSMLPRYPWE